MQSKRISGTGAGGFIGHHLVTFLETQGDWARGVDIRRPEYGTTRPMSSTCPTCGGGL